MGLHPAHILHLPRQREPLDRASIEARGSMMITPNSMPNHPIKPANEDPVKKPFVRKPHLTNRPFRNDERLLALKQQLTPPAKANTNRKIKK